MPEYIFQHPKTKKTITIFQKMTEEHVYIDSKSVKWERVFSVPQARIDTLSSIDPFNKQDFINKTKGKKMSVGDMWDTSAALSKAREKKAGKDFVKERTVSEYEKKCKVPHPLK